MYVGGDAGSIPAQGTNLMNVEIVMIENDEFASDYATQLVSNMTLEQRQMAFKHLESFFDEVTIATMKHDAQYIGEERAAMDRALAEMDAKPVV